MRARALYALVLLVIAAAAWAVPCDPPMQCIPACSVVTTSTLAGPPTGIGGLVVAGDDACDYGAPFATSMQHVNDVGVYTIAGTIALQHLTVRGGSPVAYSSCLCAGPVSSAHGEQTTDVRWCGCTLDPSVTTTVATPTTSTSSSTSTLSTSTSTTTTLAAIASDGGAYYHSRGSISTAAALYVGGQPESGGANGPYSGLTADNFWWITGRTYTHVSGVAQLETAPSSTQSWVVRLFYSETPLAASESCSTRATSTIDATLCTIANSDLSCTFDVDLAALATNVGIAAGSCFQIGFEPVGTPTATSGRLVSLVATEASGDGISALASALVNNTTASEYMALQSGSGSVIHNYWSVPKAVAACTGAFSVKTAPGSGGDAWDYKLAVSTTAKTTAQSCLDLSYTDVTGCTVSNTDHSCRFTLTAAAVPAHGCIAARRIAVNTPTAPDTETYALECTADTFESASTGGPAFFGGEDDTTLETGTWFAAADMTNSSTGVAHQYWHNGKDALTTCSLDYESESLGVGGQYNIVLRYTTSALGAAQKCRQSSGLTFTEVALCADVFGTDKHCHASDVTVSVPAYACLQLKSTTSGTITTPKSRAEWVLECRK